MDAVLLYVEEDAFSCGMTIHPKGRTLLPGKLVFVRSLLSLRASAHTGVAIPRLKGTR